MDPLIVKRAPIGNVVVEGNRRLACLKTLSREDAKFQTAECGILPQGLSDIDIATYLAQIHVIGKKPWPTQNKAWLVYWMNGGNAHLPYSVIAKNFGMSKSTVQRMIEAYQYTAQYYKDFNDEKWLRKYSYFDEAYKGRSKLAKLHKDYLEMEDDKEKLSKKFLNWFGTLIFEKRLTRGEDVRDMLKMFDKKDEEAINELAKHGIKSAMAIFNVHHPEETDKIYGAIEMATLALQNIKMMDIEELAQDNTRIQLLKNLQGSTDQILRYVDAVRARRGRS